MIAIISCTDWRYILLRAEAYNELTQTANAVTELNKIRTRAGTELSLLLRRRCTNGIENERLRSWLFEGKRYFDLQTHGRYAPSP